MAFLLIPAGATLVGVIIGYLSGKPKEDAKKDEFDE